VVACRLSSGAAVAFASSTSYVRAGTTINASSRMVGVDVEVIVNELVEAVNKRCIESARMNTFLGMLPITGAETIAGTNKQLGSEQKRLVRGDEIGMPSLSCRYRRLCTRLES
jgi:hypothetical protein